MRRTTSLLYGAAIAMAFALAVYSLYLNRTASASVAVAFMLALILIQQLPILESFEILTLKAKFRAQVDEAKSLLEHLRESAKVSARGTYLQLAYMNRLGDLGWGRKRALLNDIDRQLRNLNVPEDEVGAFKRPFLNMLTLDLARIFETTAIERLQQYRKEANRVHHERFKAGQPIRAGDASYAASIEWQRTFTAQRLGLDDPLGRTDFDRIRGLLVSWLETLPVSTDDRLALGRVLDEVATLAEASWAQGSVTAETEAYLDRYRGNDEPQDRLEELKLAPVKLASSI